MILFTLAFAEPPRFVPLEEAVQTAEIAVVGEVSQIWYEALKPGQMMTRNALDPYWIEYRVDRVIYGDMKPGQTVRVHFEAIGCEGYEVQIRRQGDQFIERMTYNDNDTVLKSEHWAAKGPQVLLLDQRDKDLWNAGYGSSPQVFTETLVKQVAAQKR